MTSTQDIPSESNLHLTQDVSSTEDISSAHGDRSAENAPTGQSVPSVNDLLQQLAHVKGQGSAAQTPAEIKHWYFEYKRLQQELKTAKKRQTTKPATDSGHVSPEDAQGRPGLSRGTLRNLIKHGTGS
jgi:hypothetical protein